MAFIKCSGGDSIKFKSGTFTRVLNQNTTVDIGFSPNYIGIVFPGKGGTDSSQKNGAYRGIYNKDFSSSYYYYSYSTAEGTGSIRSDTTKLTINNSGFILGAGNNSVYTGTYYYFAVG